MLPPLGPMLLGATPGQPVAATAVEEPVASQFADNLLAYGQESPVASSGSRDLDHNTHQAGQPGSGLEPVQLGVESSAGDSRQPSALPTTTPEHYDPALVSPLGSTDQTLPDGLPPTGSLLPLASLAPVAQGIEEKVATLAPQDRLPRLDNALDDIAGAELDDSLSNIPIVLAGSDSGAEQVIANQLMVNPATVDPAIVAQSGLAMAGSEAIRAPLNSSLVPKLSSEVLSPGAQPAATVLSMATSSVSETTNLQPGKITPSSVTAIPGIESKSQNTTSLLTAASSDHAGSLLTSKDIAAAPLRGGGEQPAMPATGLTPGQLRELLVPGSSIGPAVGATATKPGAEAAQVVNPSSSMSNPPIAATTTGDLSRVGSQLAMSAAASALTDKVSPSARIAGNLPGSNGYRDGLPIAAGNRIDVAPAPVTVATMSTQLRAGLASVEQPRVPMTMDTTALGPSGSFATTTEGSDAATPSSSLATLGRSAIATTTLPSSLMPVPTNSRLDVSDGMGGQWVGRLSQMIAQQQITGQSLRIALSPAELGALELTFSGTADNWSVSLSAQQGQTRELLESHLDRIRAMLQDLGHGEAKVSMSGQWNGGETSAGQEHSAQSRSPADQNSGWQHTPAVTRTPADISQTSKLPGGNGSGEASGGVDAYV